MPEFTLHQTAAELESRIRAVRLLDLPAEWENELVYPNNDGLSLENIPHTIARLLGAPLPGNSPLDEAVWGGEKPPENISRVVVFLTDGLGYKWLLEMMDEDDDLRADVGEVSEGRGPVPLTSVSPSTTVSALATLWTGANPAAHGIMGTVMYLHELSVLGNMLGFNPATGKHPPGALAAWGLDPQKLVPTPGLAAMFAESGVSTHSLLPKHFINSGLSLVLHRGVTRHHPHTGGSDFWLRLRDVLRETAGQRCFVSTYWPAVDALSHLYGAKSEYVRHEIKDQFARLREVLADDSVHDGQTLVLVMADHGHYDVRESIGMGEDERSAPIANALRCGMGGEKRFAYAYLRDGHRQAVTDAIESHFADCLTWVDGETALKSGLFGAGQAYAETPHRIGDLILIPRLGCAVREAAIDFPMVSAHGGLSDWEMLTPLLWREI